jgi:hypothetical protein
MGRVRRTSERRGQRQSQRHSRDERRTQPAKTKRSPDSSSSKKSPYVAADHANSADKDVCRRKVAKTGRGCREFVVLDTHRFQACWDIIQRNPGFSRIVCAQSDAAEFSAMERSLAGLRSKSPVWDRVHVRAATLRHVLDGNLSPTESTMVWQDYTCTWNGKIEMESSPHDDFRSLVRLFAGSTAPEITCVVTVSMRNGGKTDRDVHTVLRDMYNVVNDHPWVGLDSLRVPYGYQPSMNMTTVRLFRVGPDSPDSHVAGPTAAAADPVAADPVAADPPTPADANSTAAMFTAVLVGDAVSAEWPGGRFDGLVTHVHGDRCRILYLENGGGLTWYDHRANRLGPPVGNRLPSKAQIACDRASRDVVCQMCDNPRLKKRHTC